MRYFVLFLTVALLAPVLPVFAEDSAPLPVKGAKGFFDSGGEQIYYETYGEGEPVVLSHGLGGNHAIWYQQVPVLALSFRVVVWDQRGFGRSTNTGNSAGPETFVEDLRGLLDHLEIERTHLIGQSMGGWTVLGFAIEHPARVRSVVMADTIGGIYTPAIEAHFDEYIRDRMAAPPQGAQPVGPHPAIGSKIVKRDLAQAFLYEQIGSVAEPPPGNVGMLLRTTQYPADKIAGLTMPFLFVVGTEDPIFPPAVIREAATQVERGRVVEISGVGHSPYFETPELWNEAVIDFLRESTSE